MYDDTLFGPPILCLETRILGPEFLFHYLPGTQFHCSLGFEYVTQPYQARSEGSSSGWFLAEEALRESGTSVSPDVMGDMTVGVGNSAVQRKQTENSLQPPFLPSLGPLRCASVMLEAAGLAGP